MPVKLPTAYQWLYDEAGPLMLKKALELYGTVEVPGRASNPIIMGWAEECDYHSAYSDDSVPWCGLLVGVCAKRAGWEWKPGGNGLWARNWLEWGNHVDKPMLGDVLVFARGDGGHVAIYVGENSGYWFILGGNQTDMVNIVAKPKRKTGEGALLGARRAPWRIAQPANVRPVFLTVKGTLAASEA